MGLMGRVWAEIGGDASGLINAVNQAIKALRGVSNEADAFQEKLNRTGLAGETFNDMLSRQQKEANKTSSAWASIGNAVKSVLTVAVAYKAYKFFKDSIYDAVEYADEVRNVSRMIGATTEESSMLIQVSDQVGISTDTLTNSMQMAIKKGYEPTIAGLMQMSREYNALIDPMEKVRYLQERFTRSGTTGGAGMAPLLELGPEKISQMGSEVKKGLILSQQDVYQARLTAFMINDINDTVQAARTNIGAGAGNTLYNLFALDETKTKDLYDFAAQLNSAGVSAEEFNAQMGEAVKKAGYVVDEYGNLRQRTGIAWEGSWLQIDPKQQDMVVEGFMNIARAQNYATDSTKYMTDSEKEEQKKRQEQEAGIRASTQSQLISNAITADGVSISDEYKSRIADLSEKESEYTEKLKGRTEAQIRNNAKLKETANALEEVRKEMEDLTGQYKQQQGISLYNLVAGDATNITEKELMKLAHASGILDDKTYGLESGALDLIDAFDGTTDGLVDMSKWTEKNYRDYSKLNEILADLKENTPEGWDVTSYYNIIVTTYKRNVSGIGNVSLVGDTGTNSFQDFVSGKGIFSAPGGMHGGSFIGMQHGGVVPPGFSNDGMPIWVSSGERVDVTPAGNKSVSGQSSNTLRFYGPVTFKIDKDVRTIDLMGQLKT